MTRVQCDAEALGDALDANGHAVLPGLLDAAECAALAGLYDRDDESFRSRVVMSRHGYGQGEYRYFAYPLPPVVQMLRCDLYAALAQVAEQWSARLGDPITFPARHADFVSTCAAAGQTRPTPLLLRYRAGDYNRLHQDVYGALVFPMQVVVLLSVPGKDFTGGELVLTEARARMQSRASVVQWKQGDGVVIPVRTRPVATSKGWSRAAMRHGVSTIMTGTRHTLGIIFHDAT